MNNNSEFRSGAWWLEKETNDVIRIISRDSVYDIENIKGGVVCDDSIFYQYYTDDKNRSLNTTQWVTTAEELCDKFNFKSC